MNRKRAALTAAFLSLPIVVIGVLQLWPVARTAGPLPHRAYVWQRAWTPAVREAIREHASDFDRLVVLAGELAPGAEPKMVWAQVDYDLLAGLGRPVGLALRVGTYSGPFGAAAPTTKALLEAADRVRAAADEAGLAIAELQIDFDCAESRLAGYAHWIRLLKARLGDVPVTLTALPSWLDRGTCRELVAAADGYVLQVHSFVAPPAEGAATLCDPAAAVRAVEQAARLGKPFWVALPTYGYRAEFDAAGKLLRLRAEQRESPPGPNVASRRLLLADPAAMSKLVRDWSADRPELLRGVIWYRLAVRGDRLNWPGETLRAVMAGQTPTARVGVVLLDRGAGLYDVRLRNPGDAPGEAPAGWRLLHAPGARLAADGFGGYTIEAAGPDAVAWRREAPAAFVQPGDDLPAGWIRFARAAAPHEVTIDGANHLPTPASQPAP